MKTSLDLPQTVGRVLAVGGAGDMGRHAVRALARLGAAEAIVVADIDRAKADRFVATLGPEVTSLHLDVTDAPAVAEAFSRADVVINTMGPFARFALPLMQAAITAGCDYLDIDDDWQSTLQALDLDSEARKAGVRMVVGLGASPGITNLLAMTAAQQLDSVHTLHTGWSLASAHAVPEPGLSSQGAAAGEHWIHQCSSPIPVIEEGGVVEIEPLDAVSLQIPELGPQVGWTMGHPEPVTLGRNFPHLRSSLNLQTIDAASMEQLRGLVDAVRSGALSIPDGARMLEGREIGEPDPMPTMWGLAKGTRDGREVSVFADLPRELPGQMGGATGIPLAVGVELLRRRLVAGPGVHAPETAVNPRHFFEVLGGFVTGPRTEGEPVVRLREA